MKAATLKGFGARKPRAKRVDREGLEQADLIEEFDARYPRYARLLYHVPNGGHRHKATAGKLKAQGVRAGVPDLVLAVARGGYFGLYIEFKAQPPYDADVSPAQYAYIQALNAEGYLAVVCRGSFDAMEAIRAYLIQPPTLRAVP
ncbi:VRR-NUC domain-containing protein [Pseudomonas sp. B26(2017)]|uniref:VRR-NUC domain-containing protein n=1 Tax=Pseudomonas sp. B26(2017) TaxID=1981732 RepID=UPI000A1DA50F|nr:VRR-NUC domain-containing protein [Pseudomonas sp. B26(2017)]